MWLILNAFPKPVVAAITGNSPGAGCIMSLACDYRVMIRGPPNDTEGKRAYHIGLNETKLGIMVPSWAVAAYAYLIGNQAAELLLQLGESPTADEAFKIGLVDEVTTDAESCVASAFQQAEKFLSVPQQVRWMSREMMRRPQVALPGHRGGQAVRRGLLHLAGAEPAGPAGPGRLLGVP